MRFTKKKFVFLFYTAILIVSLNAESLKICTFNVERFGKTKIIDRPHILDVITDIIIGFDIICIQEFRSKDPSVMEALNEAVQAKEPDFELIYGERSGTSSQKEQNLIFFNTALVKADQAQAYTYSDINEQSDPWFAYDPFIATFTEIETGEMFNVVTIHTRPSRATEEIEGLKKIIPEIVDRTGDDDIIFLGDFNADGSYYDEETLDDLFPPDGFKIIVENDNDSTVSDYLFAYDRIITTNPFCGYYSGDYQTLVFSEEFDLATLGIEEDEISDHYPVWAEFTF